MKKEPWFKAPYEELVHLGIGSATAGLQGEGLIKYITDYLNEKKIYQFIF